MKRSVWGWYGLGAAALLLGMIGFGVSVSSVLLITVLVACPLMMLFMMVGGHGDQHSGHDHSGDAGHATHVSGDVADEDPQDTPWDTDGNRPRSLR